MNTNIRLMYSHRASFRHDIESNNGTEDDFTAVIRATCIPAEDCHQGLQEFQVTLRDNCIAYQGWQLSAVSGLNRASV